MASFLEFEKPIAELQGRIDELRATAADGTVDIAADLVRLQGKSDKLLRDTFAKLTPWQKTQVARHPERRISMDYVAGLFDEFVPLAGDRAFADDQAIMGGFATFRGTKVIGSVTKRAPTPPPACATISAWANPKAIARRSGWLRWPTGSACRW